MKIELDNNIGVTNFKGKVVDHSLDSAMIALLAVQQYSRPLYAAVREAVTNAADSHVRAGKADVPFEVRVDHTFNSKGNKAIVKIGVRDFGVGMTLDFVQNEFFSLGRSTKRDSDDQGGAFGLGGKAALGLSKMLAVTLYDGMTAQTVVGSLDEHSRIVVRAMDPRESDEPQGVLISFCVECAANEPLEKSWWSAIAPRHDFYLGLDEQPRRCVKLTPWTRHPSWVTDIVSALLPVGHYRSLYRARPKFLCNGEEYFYPSASVFRTLVEYDDKRTKRLSVNATHCRQLFHDDLTNPTTQYYQNSVAIGALKEQPAHIREAAFLANSLPIEVGSRVVYWHNAAFMVDKDLSIKVEKLVLDRLCSELRDADRHGCRVLDPETDNQVVQVLAKKLLRATCGFDTYLTASKEIRFSVTTDRMSLKDTQLTVDSLVNVYMESMAEFREALLNKLNELPKLGAIDIDDDYAATDSILYRSLLISAFEMAYLPEVYEWFRSRFWPDFETESAVLSRLRSNERFVARVRVRGTGAGSTINPDALAEEWVQKSHSLFQQVVGCCWFPQAISRVGLVQKSSEVTKYYLPKLGAQGYSHALQSQGFRLMSDYRFDVMPMVLVVGKPGERRKVLLQVLEKYKRSRLSVTGHVAGEDDVDERRSSLDGHLRSIWWVEAPSAKRIGELKAELEVKLKNWPGVLLDTLSGTGQKLIKEANANEPAKPGPPQYLYCKGDAQRNEDGDYTKKISHALLLKTGLPELLEAISEQQEEFVATAYVRVKGYRFSYEKTDFDGPLLAEAFRRIGVRLVLCRSKADLSALEEAGALPVEELLGEMYRDQSDVRRQLYMLLAYQQRQYWDKWVVPVLDIFPRKFGGKTLQQLHAELAEKPFAATRLGKLLQITDGLDGFAIDTKVEVMRRLVNPAQMHQLDPAVYINHLARVCVGNGWTQSYLKAKSICDSYKASRPDVELAQLSEYDGDYHDQWCSATGYTNLVTSVSPNGKAIRFSYQKFTEQKLGTGSKLEYLLKLILSVDGARTPIGKRVRLMKLLWAIR